MHTARIPAPQHQRQQPVSAARHSSYARPFDPVAEQFGPISLATVYPEAALMCAVLEDALRCFRSETRIQKEGGRAAREAENWFSSNDSQEFFSFVFVCRALGLDPDFIRNRLMDWRQSRRVLRRGIDRGYGSSK